MYIQVKLTPNSKKEIFNQISNNRFEISLREKAENNMANRRMLEIINLHFGNPAGGCKIVNGHHSRVKLLKIGNE